MASSTVGRKAMDMEVASTASGTNSEVSVDSRDARREAKLKIEKRERAEQRAADKARAERALARHMINRTGAHTKVEKDDALCSQLFTRVFGSASMILSMFLFVIAGVIFAQPCCGENFSYNESSWRDQCATALDNSTSGTVFEDNNTSNRSCYHKNITGIVLLVFVSIFMLVGCVVLCYGECAYDINVEKDEDKIDRAAAELKWLEMERMEMAREEEALAKQERKYERSLRAESRSAASSSRRAHSIGSPATPSSRHISMANGRIPIVASHPYVYGNSNVKPFNPQQHQAYQVM